jgi:hypothetical protein
MKVKSNLIILSIFLLFFQHFLAQTRDSDTIEIKKGFLGKVYKYQGKRLCISKMLKLTETDSAAHNELKKVRKYHIASLVMGGAFITATFPVSFFFGAGVSDVMLLGYLCASTPVSYMYSKHLNKSVKIYNKNH